MLSYIAALVSCLIHVLSGPTPQDSSGALRGSGSKLGDDGHPINTAKVADVTKYQKVPGQDLILISGCSSTLPMCSPRSPSVATTTARTPLPVRTLPS